ncbi:MAG: hypothetical protein EOP62_08515 [Sphingomonadales bacterium]|nr:MAG: hypothetical protein EOP62_08515 [Sphingomonadales bacterium]
MEEDYQKLRGGWADGDREREHALHLLFLAWMHWADPSSVTGMTDDPEAAELWNAIFDHFGGEESADTEFLYVAAIMATVTPWGFGGEEKYWVAAAERMETRAVCLDPGGFAPGTFEGRGDYGEYFAHQSRRRAEALSNEKGGA